MPETPEPNHEDQPEPHAEENLEQARHTAAAHELVDIYGANSTAAFIQIMKELEGDPDQAEIRAIVVDLFVEHFMDDARRILQEFGSRLKTQDLLVSRLIYRHPVVTEVARLAMARALAEDNDRP